MSGFQTPNNKKKWVDSESESEGENHGRKHVGDDELISAQDGVPAQKDTEPNEEDSSSEESEESSSEDEDDESNKLRLAPSQPVAKKEKVKQLSKKERLELRQQELSALDSLLAELGVDAKPAEGEPAPAAAPVAASATTEGDKKDKKKKKKPTVPKKAEASPAEAEVSNVVIAPDAKDILKARTQKKKGSATISEAQKIAMAEAKASSSSKKNKKDKSKFCEYSY